MLILIQVYVLFVDSDKQEILVHSDDAFAPVGYLRFLEMHLEAKDVRFSTVVSYIVKASAFDNTAYCCYFIRQSLDWRFQFGRIRGWQQLTIYANILLPILWVFLIFYYSFINQEFDQTIVKFQDYDRFGHVNERVSLPSDKNLEYPIFLVQIAQNTAL